MLRKLQHVGLFTLLLAPGLWALSSAEAPLSGSPAFSAKTDAVAPADNYREKKEAARRAHRSGIEEFAKWAHKNKAYRLRDSAYEALLAYDTDHKEARKFLKYTFDKKKDKWSRRRPYKLPKEGKPEIVEEGNTKRDGLDAALIENLLAAIDDEEEALGPVKTRAELRELLAIVPDDPDVRDRLGFVAVETKGKIVWTTQVILDTKEARETIKADLETCRSEVPEITDAKIKDRETKWGIDWEGAVETDRVRVLTNAGTEEQKLVAGICHQAWEHLPLILGSKSRAPKDFTVYLLDGDDAKAAFIANYPNLKDELRERLPQYGGHYFNGTPHLGIWAPDEVVRPDFACKVMTTRYIGVCYGVTGKVGWLTEGIGQYVNYLVVGTRRTYQITTTEYDDPDKPRSTRDIGTTDGDWIADAGDVLSDAKPLRLAKIMGLNSSELTREDLVLSYALCAYLIEGHGSFVVRDLCKRIGEGKASSTIILEDVLEMKMPAIQTELIAWIEQVGGHDW